MFIGFHCSMDSPESSNPAATSISAATTSSAALLQSVPSSQEAPTSSNLLPILPVSAGKDGVPRFPGLRRVNLLSGTRSIKRLQGSQSVGKTGSQNVDQHRKVFAQPDVEFNYNKDHKEITDAKHDICQRAGSQDVTESNCNSHLLPIAFPMIQEVDIREKVNSPTMTAAKDIILNNMEADQDKHAALRRCLQFDEVHPNADSKHSDLPDTPENSKFIDSSGFDLATTSSMGHQSESTKPRVPPRAGADTAPAFSRSPGIGLHLNSIVSSLPTGGIATARLSLGQMDNFNLKSESNMNCYAPEPMKNGVLEHFAPSEDSGHESRNLIQSYSVSSLPSLVLKPVTLEAATSSDSSLPMRKSISQSNFVQVNNKCCSPTTKKRKNASIDMDGEGCKHCNCRKTKCLKLYCDCFSAGIYCAGPCACQGCLNKPEYEDTVTEMRQLIESRNPLAFAPKIVQPKTKLASTSVEGVSAPSSAKHKRGCNCKKSMCLKKYCECYQSNVGCSDGCRCEGCKNVHGRKGDYGSSEMMDQGSQIDNFDGLSDGNLEAVPTRQVLPNAGLYNLRNVSSSAPSLKYPDCGSAVVQQLPCRRSSCESGLTALSQGISLRSPGELDSYDKYLNDSLNLVPSGQRLSSVDSVSHPSPSYEGQSNVFTYKPLSNAPSSATASSASSKTKDLSGSGAQVSPGSGSSSFLWHSSTTNSMPRQGTKHQRFDKNEDMMPEVLENSTPIKPVKVSSPSRKRVSPPHKQSHVFGSSSSAALRSGRKYVLKSISSFPPLTPLIEAKGSNQENANPGEYQERMDN